MIASCELALMLMLAGGGPVAPSPAGAAAIVRHAPAEPRLSESERQELREAVERIARRATGRVVWSREAGMYVPELKKESAARDKTRR